MEWIGTTRLGNKIVLEWESDESGIKYLKFQRFSAIEEHFDAWIVLELFSILVKRKNISLYGSHEIDENAEKHRELVGRKLADHLSNELNLKNSIDRANYARQLLRIEFKI